LLVKASSAIVKAFWISFASLVEFIFLSVIVCLISSLENTSGFQFSPLLFWVCTSIIAFFMSWDFSFGEFSLVVGWFGF